MINPRKLFPLLPLAGAAILLLASPLFAAPAGAPPELDAYNVVFDKAAHNDRGSIPMGNGAVALSLWVEENGDLCFYIASNDAWTEADRQVKLGKVSVSLSPNPFAKGQPFRQELKLREGCAEISAGEKGKEVRLRVFVDSGSPTIFVTGSAAMPVTVRATYENWRTQPRVYPKNAVEGGNPAPITESADVIENTPEGVFFHHRNDSDCIKDMVEANNLGSALPVVPETLEGRTFGGWMALNNAAPATGNSVQTSQPVTEFELKVTTLVAQTKTLEDWSSGLRKIAARVPGAEEAARRTAAWWAAYWGRSWIFVHGDQSAGIKIPQSTQPLRLGADSDGGSLFSGRMARAGVFTRALSAGEVAKLASGSPDAPSPFTEGLAASWRLGQLKDGYCANDAGGESLRAKSLGAVETGSGGGVQSAIFKGGHFEIEGAFEPKEGYTLEAWVYLPARSPSCRIFDKLTANHPDGFLLDLYPGRNLRHYLGSELLSGPPLPADKWTHVAVTVDAGTGAERLFINGLPVAGNGAQSPTPSPVTRAYVLTKWMSTCCARGEFPIKFNGWLFNLAPGAGPASAGNNPDWRPWGYSYFYQNTRLPYLSMPARGEADFMEPFLRYYLGFLKLNQARAKTYCNADGQMAYEITTTYGVMPSGIYGYNHSKDALWQTGNQWGGQVYLSPALEFSNAMLDYYDATGDQKFLTEKALPYIHETFRFIESRFKERQDGHIVLSPLHAIETVWNATDPMPSVAGMHAVLDRVLALPGNVEDRGDYDRWKAMTPPLPTTVIDGKETFAAARIEDGARHNTEAPELYCVFPFRAVTLMDAEKAIAINTFDHLKQRGFTNPYPHTQTCAPCPAGNLISCSGWQQVGMFAANLGLADEARDILVANCNLYSRMCAFPAMWGPIYDALPDGDHAANIPNTLQLMAFQTDGNKIILLPAWPKGWDVSFKFHAPENTTVECEVKNGKVTRLDVSPKARQKDVVFAGAN